MGGNPIESMLTATIDPLLTQLGSVVTKIGPFLAAGLAIAVGIKWAKRGGKSV